MSYQRVGATEEVEISPGQHESKYNEERSGSSRSKYPFKGPKLQTAISIAAGTVMCLFGYEQGVFGGILVGQDFMEYFKHPSPSLQGFVTSIYDLGCFFGALIALVVGEWLGRKRMLVVFTIIMMVGIIVQTAATSMNHLLWGRLIAGIGNGGNTATAPVWHVETSHHSAKGKAVVKEMTVNVFGFVVSNVITLACSGIETEAQWRFPLGIQLLFVVVILSLVPLLPESPRWLLARNRDAEAKEVLACLSTSENALEIEAEFVEIRASVRLEQAVQASWVQILKGGPATRRLLLGMLLQVAQQLTGINTLCYFLPLVLHKSVGLSELASRLLATGNAVSYMLATAASLLVIERLGRRPLLMVTAAAQAIAFLGIAISTSIGQNQVGNLLPGIIATIFIWVYFTAFSFGWIAVPWLYPAEINSLSMRTKGAALATSCDWLFNYFVVQGTPIGIHYLHWGLYLIFAIFNAAFVPIVYYLVVETAGRSLEQIDRWFVLNPGWLVHKADHSPNFENRSTVDDGVFQVAEDNEGMMKAYEIQQEEEAKGSHP
ncbi:MAG: hypothetical protein M1827_005798 [Pycnora praestabilis]|nr:MAG: hypothetical protein M1827_005798 [Pycnora praestabilis]